MDTIAAVIDAKGEYAWLLWLGCGMWEISDLPLDSVPYKCMELWFRSNPKVSMCIDLKGDDDVLVKTEPLCQSVQRLFRPTVLC